MKKHAVFRSLLSWLLALSILVGLFPIGAMAEENSTTATDSLAEEDSTTATGTLAEENAALAETLRQRMENLANPYNELVDMTGLEKCPVLDGDFYIVHQDSNGNAYALNPVKEVRQYRLGSTEVAIQDGRVVNGDYESILTLCPWDNASYVSHAILGVDGNYFYRASADSTYHFVSGQKVSYELIPTEGFVEIRYYVSATRKLPICHGVDGLFYMNEYYNSQSDILFSLYRLSETAVLYRTLREMEGYLDGNSNKTYPDTVYKIFLTAFEQALEVYNSYNDSMCPDEESKATIEETNSSLQQRKSELVFANRDTDYIDVSVEIMDFKADSLLFEYMDTSNHKHTYIYELTRDYSGLAGVPFPGVIGTSTIPAPDGALKTFATGLTLQELQNGELIYTEETVTYVANLMMIDETWKTESFLNTLPGDDCRWFLQKIEAIQKKAAGIDEEEPTESETTEDATEETTEDATEDTTEDGETEETPKTPEELRAEALGSMDDTISKTIPFTLDGVEDRRNGGVLLAKDCETAFDLAYYALNNIWRPVGEEDVLDDGDETTTDYHYNTTVPERARLRMYWDPATGMYTFDATNQVIYNGAYIYNSLPLKQTTTPVNTPRFMPIDGLGYEKDGVETDRSTYYSTQGFGTDSAGGNYHYTLHASGSFAYYEDQELYFSFLGDDDVYFFIDGKMVMDLGGAHQAAGTDFSLNREALLEKGLDLKDGEIYSFDMFYAERHTTGSNMRFCTNMHIMDTQTVTTKGQYLVESDGQSSVNPSTGMGDSLQESAVMNIGDTVAYSFELLNIRDVAVEELSFTDDSLGTDISPNEIRLTDPNLTNGALTGIEDISLYYRSYDLENKKLNEEAFRSYTASEMLDMIESRKTGNGKDQPLPTGSYWVTLEAETGVKDLKDLLAAGVLPMCQLTVYGFRRTMGEEDVPYVNTVVSNCSFTRTENSLVGMQQERISITGSASRTLRVPAVDDLVKPTAQRVQIVLDYGKPIQVPIESLKEKISVVDPVTVGDYLGLVTNGVNGNTYKELTETPQCGKNGDTLMGNSGTFTREGEVLEYRLSKIMSSVEKVYAVFALNNYSVSAGSQSRVHPYVMVELQLIPATSMYYETDFATGVFTTEAVGTTEPWSTEGEENEQEEYQNNGYEKDQYPTEAAGEESGTEEAAGSADAAESSTPALKAPTRAATNGPGATVISEDYVMLDFNDDAAGGWETKDNTVNLDTEKGVLYGDLVETIGEGYYDPFVKMKNKLLNYTIKAGDQARARVRINDFNGTTLQGYQMFFWYENENGEYTNSYITAELEWELGIYQTLIWDLSEHAGKTINQFRVDPVYSLATETATGSYEIDYMYIGSEADAPDDRYISSDVLFVDLTNTVSDRHRYALPQYGGKNRDLTGWRATHYVSVNGEPSTDITADYEIDNNEEGTVTHKPYIEVSSGNSLSLYMETLQYDPDNAEVLQFRIKMQGMTCGSISRMKLWYTGGSEMRTQYFNAQTVKNGEYQIVTMPLSQAFRNTELIKSFRIACHEFKVTMESSVIYDYIYIGPRDQAPYQEALFFDFTDTEADRQRYENEVYCGWNYDIENWKATWRSGSGFGSVTHGDGYISASTSGYSYTYVQTGDNGKQGNIYYIPDKAEVVAVRFKISDTMSVTSSSYVTFNYLPNGATSYVTGQKVPISTDMHPEQGYITLVGENTTEGILNAEYLNGLRVNFYNLEGTGTITIDYIYMGPESGVPSDSKLLFDFKNDTAAINRYTTNTYGFHSDYDSNDAKWEAHSTANKTIDKNNEGSITISQGSNTNGLHTGIFVETSDGSGQFYTKPLRYRPSQGDYVQIRVKLNGLSLLNTGNTNLRLYYLVDDQVEMETYTPVGKLGETHFDGKYWVFTASMDSNFTNASVVHGIRAYLTYIQSADGTTPGSMTIDYIYVGPKSELPTPLYTVTYQNEAGKVLETHTVHKGEASVYSKKIPTKNRDANYHYEFDQWVTTNGATVDLKNITSDLTLKPGFTAEAHKWDNTKIQEHSCTTNEVISAVCSVCDYPHTYVSKYATGHIYVDNKCRICGKENTGTILHFLENSPEITYDWSTLKQVTAPTFQTAEPGYMTGSFNKAGSQECYVGMDATNPMDNIAHKVSSPDEIIQVRLKLTMSQQLALATNSYRVYLNTSDMATGTTYDTAHGVSPYSVSEDQEGYTILSFPTPLIAIGNTIEAIRLDFFRNMADVTGLSGDYSIDYVYFGHCCDAPVPQHALNSGEVTLAPTCVATGIRLHGCFYCEYTEETVIPVGEHYYAPGKTVAPTCSSVGYKGGSFCIGCGKVQVIEGVEQVAEVLPQIPHSYSYTQISDSEHRKDCMFCDDSSTEVHEYFYGQCRCGAYEPEHMVYGYDTSYLDDNALSNGTSLFVKGAGVTVNDQQGTTSGTYTRATFSFTGTGFDLISRTGAEQATIRVVIYSDKEMTKASRVKAVTANNKGELELYQIPVVSVHDLDYGTYYVAVGVNKEIRHEEGSDLALLNRGNQFYFDAVRIYDPLNTKTDSDPLTVYERHGEAYPQITELRDLLLTETQFSAAGTNTTGAVFIDASKDNEGNHQTAVVGTYKDIGPKNETYLLSGQAVSFKLLVEGNVLPKSLSIGVKTINGGEAVLTTGIGKAAPTGDDVIAQMTKTRRTLVSATAMYYSLSLQESDFQTDENGCHYTYVILTNTGSEGEKNLLSITDIKAAFATDPTITTYRSVKAPVKYVVDGEAFQVAEAFLLGTMSELPVDEDAAIYHSLNLASDISINYVVDKKAMADYDSLRLQCSLPKYEGTALVGYEELWLEPADKGEYYYFTLTDLTALQMNDEIYAVLHMEKDGWSHTSHTDVYSISTYAYRQLNKEGTAPELMSLCAELLRYGAMAQTYKGYRTDALVDGAMTEEQKSLQRDLDTVSFGDCNRVLEDCAQPTVKWVGKTLSLDSKVTVKYAVDVSSYTGTEPLSLRISYKDYTGQERYAVIQTMNPYQKEKGYYTFSFDGLLAAELRTELTVAVYAGQEQASHTLIYSPDTYGKGKTGTLAELCKAVFAYSDSARSFFGAS